ncbi:MAG: glycine cleavage system protein H [Clostridiales bacterium GWC2_40_7]|nr:MAG: glycine cleavage system protein H [Clostridiales bacterium GWC2_40_7]
MTVLDGLKYSKDHEWIKVEGNKAHVGITDHAQHALGSIVFVELPGLAKTLSEGDILGVVESVKAASDVYSPVSGTVLQVNEELTDVPEKLNEEPYDAWIAVLELSDASQLDALMDAEAYEKFCSEEA